MLTAFLKAATAFLNAWPLFASAKLYKQLDKIDDEIFSLGLDGSPVAKLRLEQLGKRRDRIRQQIRLIRPTDDHTGPGR